MADLDGIAELDLGRAERRGYPEAVYGEGKTLEEMWGQKWAPVLDPDTQRVALERWLSSIETGEPFEMVIPIRNRDGVPHPFITRAAPLRDDTGRVVRWFGTNTHIESLKPAGTR